VLRCASLFSKINEKQQKKARFFMMFFYGSWLTPLFALLPVGGFAAYFGVALMRMMLFGFSSAFFFSTGIPTAVASYAWAHLSSRRFEQFFLVVMPLFAVSLFALKVGFTLDALYASYWLLLPVMYALLSVSARSSDVARSVASSLIAHMVGSLLVAYAGAPIAWFALIPVVFVERLAVASMMYAVARGMQAMSARVLRAN
jgi:hypothetical protein